MAKKARVWTGTEFVELASAQTDLTAYSTTAQMNTAIAAAPSGLTFITGGAFTTATSFSLPNDTFSATFRNYKMIVNITAMTNNADFTMRLRAAGADNTTSNYMSMLTGITTTGTTTGLVGSLQTNWIVGESHSVNVRYGYSFDILQPQVAQQTFATGHLSFVNKANSAQIGQSGNQNFIQLTQFDSLSFISSVASSMTGTFRVYGYSES